MLLKIMILTPFIFAFQILFANDVNFDNFNHIYALDNLKDFNIAATGDWSCTPNTKNTVNSIVNNNPELVLGLGDYAYRNDAACWLEIIKPIENKMQFYICKDKTCGLPVDTVDQAVQEITKLQSPMS